MISMDQRVFGEQTDEAGPQGQMIRRSGGFFKQSCSIKIFLGPLPPINFKVFWQQFNVAQTIV